MLGAFRSLFEEQCGREFSGRFDPAKAPLSKHGPVDEYKDMAEATFGGDVYYDTTDLTPGEKTALQGVATSIKAVVTMGRGGQRCDPEQTLAAVLALRNMALRCHDNAGLSEPLRAAQLAELQKALHVVLMWPLFAVNSRRRPLSAAQQAELAAQRKELMRRVQQATTQLAETGERLSAAQAQVLELQFQAQGARAQMGKDADSRRALQDSVKTLKAQAAQREADLGRLSKAVAGAQAEAARAQAEAARAQAEAAKSGQDLRTISTRAAKILGAQEGLRRELEAARSHLQQELQHAVTAQVHLREALQSTAEAMKQHRARAAALKLDVDTWPWPSSSAYAGGRATPEQWEWFNAQVQAFPAMEKYRAEFNRLTQIPLVQMKSLLETVRGTKYKSSDGGHGNTAAAESIEPVAVELKPLTSQDMDNSATPRAKWSWVLFRFLTKTMAPGQGPPVAKNVRKLQAYPGMCDRLSMILRQPCQQAEAEAWQLAEKGLESITASELDNAVAEAYRNLPPDQKPVMDKKYDTQVGYTLRVQSRKDEIEAELRPKFIADKIEAVYGKGATIQKLACTLSAILHFVRECSDVLYTFSMWRRKSTLPVHLMFDPKDIQQMFKLLDNALSRYMKEGHGHGQTFSCWVFGLGFHAWFTESEEEKMRQQVAAKASTGKMAAYAERLQNLQKAKAAAEAEAAKREGEAEAAANQVAPPEGSVAEAASRYGAKVPTDSVASRPPNLLASIKAPAKLRKAQTAQAAPVEAPPAPPAPPVRPSGPSFLTDIRSVGGSVAKAAGKSAPAAQASVAPPERPRPKDLLAEIEKGSVLRKTQNVAAAPAPELEELQADASSLLPKGTLSSARDTRPHALQRPQRAQ
jgi:hypothetical protein